jgi:hypothetical protein
MAGALVPVWCAPALAQDYDDDDNGPSRVARISFVQGDVSVLEPEGYDWESTDVNAPVFEGYELYVDQGSRAEIALGARSFLRVANGADVTFSQFDTGWAQITVASGVAVLSIDSRSRTDQYSLSAPAAAVTPIGAGTYRVDVADNGDTWVTLERGTADVSTTAGSFRATEGDVASLSYDDPYSVDLVGDSARYYTDDLDQWVAQRDDYYGDLYRRDLPGPVLALGDRDDIYGLAELSRYGTWLALGSNLFGWQPQYARDPNWSPYQDGYWDYSTVSGYTWVSNEAWGWAPYHYGRWNYDDRAGWVWLPTHGAQTDFDASRTARYHWKPALVYLWQAPGSSQYAWVPLAPGERYVPFSTPTIATAQRAGRAPVPQSFRPRYLQERRGIVALEQNALVRRQKPTKLAPVTAETVAPATTAQAAAPKVVELPKPSRGPAVGAPAKAKPPVALRQRAVVVDQAAAASAPKPTTPADQVLRSEAKPQRAERKAERRQLKLERKQNSAVGTTTQPEPTTAAPSPAATESGTIAPVVRAGKRGGRKLDAASEQPVTRPGRDAATAPAPRVNRNSGQANNPGTVTTTSPADGQQPATTTTAAPTDQQTDATPAPADRNGKGKGQGRGQGKGQGKGKNKNKNPDNAGQTEPTTNTPPPR